MKYYISLFLIAIVLNSCHSKSTDSQSAKSNARRDSIQLIPKENVNTIAAERTPIEAVKKFLQWYRYNYNSLYKQPFVPAEAEGLGKQYRVDFKITKTFLQRLGASGFIDQHFIEKLGKQFQKSDSVMLANKQNDGPAEGLDYDLILRMQEGEMDFKAANKYKFNSQSIDAGKMVVAVNLDNPLCFELVKRDKGWLIWDTHLPAQQ